MAVDPVSLAITAGLMAAQMALTATQKIKGPRLDDLNVSLADYGTPIPRIWGTRRINPQIMWAEKLREKKKKSKTKGGKYTEYKYYGTWAVLLCDHEIDSVTRIWFDKRLIYQRTKAGPISVAVAALGMLGDSSNIKLADGLNMRIYLGTEDQMPDPRIEAWCEDRYGADSCPAYRGSAYIVFQDIPLETVGNRIPQITVEVVNDTDANYLYEQRTTSYLGLDALFATNGSWLAYHGAAGTEIEWWDVPTRTLLGASSSDAFLFGRQSNLALASDGTAYFCGADLSPQAYLFSCSPLGVHLQTPLTGSWGYFFGRTRVLEAGVNRRILTSYHLDDGIDGYVDGSVHVDTPGLRSRDFCVDGSGDCWGLFHPDATSDEFVLTNLSVLGSHTFTGLVTRSSEAAAQVCYVAAHGHFFVMSDGKFYIIDEDTMTITASGNFNDAVKLDPANIGAVTAWDPIGFDEYSLEDGSLVRDLTHTSWGSGAFVADGIYEPVNDAIWTRQPSGDDLFIYYLDRVSPNGVTLQTIVDDVAEWCGLTGHDSSALTQTVDGYSVTQGAAKSMIEPLLDIHDVDARPHDFQVQFKVRGSSPSGTIATADFVREGDSDRYGVTIAQDTDLPRRVTFTFADRDKDQQANTVIAQRPLDAMDSNREESIDLSTYVDTPDGAQQKADRYFRRQWNSRERTTNSLTLQKLGLEPGDVTTIELDGVNRNVKLDKMTIGPRQIDCEFIRDETSFAAINIATTGPDMEGRDDEEIYIPGPIKGIVIDGPLVEDVDNRANPFVYYFAGPLAGDFSGAILAEVDSSGQMGEVVGGVDSSSDSRWGIALNELATANYNLWDRGNELNVNVRNGPLTSVTEADINADPSLNLFALGAPGRWEYANFTTATLESDGTYTLSGFKRGRRGTEMNVANHEAGDIFVLLDNRFVEERGFSDIGDEISFKVQAPLRDIEAAEQIDIAFEGNTLKPRAPVVWHVVKEDDGDIVIELRSRTRLGGDWNGSTIPTGETIEAYEFDVYRSGEIKRTLTSSTKQLTYSASAQIEDGGDIAPTALDGFAYQMSATVGRGFARAA